MTLTRMMSNGVNISISRIKRNLMLEVLAAFVEALINPAHGQ